MIIENPVEKLLQKPVQWLKDQGPENDIAISSRIRLARNIADCLFPPAASIEEKKRVVDLVKIAAEESPVFDKAYFVESENLSNLDRMILIERRVVSRDFVSHSEGSALLVSSDESSSVMINEEDHLRIQEIGAGICFNQLWEKISKIDDLLSEKLNFAFDDKLGFLTSCLTNIGTGMRASAMLHLPALVLVDQINQVKQAVNKLGLAVRGIFGEGTANVGNLFQISNQSTLGESEEQIIQRLETVIKQIIIHEKFSRQKLVQEKKNYIMNIVGRAYGILKHSYIISSEEALNSLSTLRLGVDLGMFSTLDIHTVNELFVLVQPGHLQKYAQKQIDDPAERDVFRASLIRSKLKKTKA